MTKYARPTDVPQPSQGSWRYSPAVRVFRYATPEDLQAAINAWILSNLTEPFTVYIHDIKFSTTGAGGNTQFSALAHYTVTAAD